MVFDDLQWADEPSVDLLIHFLQLTEEVPILFVCAFRPELEEAIAKMGENAQRARVAAG